METLLFMSFFIFLFYLIFNINKFGIKKLTSLSNTYYLLRDEWKPKAKILFPITLIAMTMTLFAPFMVLPGNETTISVLLRWVSCATLGFVGVAPLFKGIDKIRHFVFAGLCALTGLLWLMIFTPFWFVPLILLGIFFILAEITETIHCWLFWFEMDMFFSVYLF